MTPPSKPPAVPDTVELLPSTADALDALGVCPVGRVNVNLESMAWLCWVLREKTDDPALFPHGKWATIQRIESQLAACARAAVCEMETP